VTIKSEKHAIETIDKPHFYMVYCSIFEATNRVLSSDFRGNRSTYAEGS